MSVLIKEEDFIQSIADGIQFISYYHPVDYIRHLARAYEREESPAARDAMAQILTNSRMCAEGKRPLCQDTGIVNVFLKVGMGVRFDTKRTLQELCDEGVRRGYLHPDNPLRASVLDDPLFARKNTRDNTPCILHVELVPGDKVDVQLASKGGGSENKSKFAMLNPSDSLVDWVLKTVPTMGAGWCPPGMLGIGVGGTAEKAMLMAKQSLMEDIDMYELLARGPQNKLEELRIELYEKVNALGIGAQGLGGDTTVLDVKVATAASHAALLPNCAATRFVTFTMPDSGPAQWPQPAPATWDGIPDALPASGGRRVDLDALTRAEVASWKVGETLLLSGRLLTGRDAAHKRMDQLLARGEPLPVPLQGRALYYVGPVDPVAGEAVGPAGPTTAARMDKFMPRLLADSGLLVTIGKAERGPLAVQAIQTHAGAYLSAVGGAAYLVSQAVRAARVVAFADLGMEAIYEFEVRDMPVTVAIDARGRSVHAVIPIQAA